MGHDRFSYGAGQELESVHLLAARPRSWTSLGEQQGLTSGSWLLGGDAHFSGGQDPDETVLQVDSLGWLSYRFELQEQDLTDPEGGGATAGGGGSSVLPPTPPWVNGDVFGDSNHITFLEASGSTPTDVAMHLRPATDRYELGIELGGAAIEWIELPQRPFDFDFDWWLNADESSGFALWVDDVMVFRRSPLPVVLVIEEIRIGILETWPAGPSFEFDDIAVHGGDLVSDSVLLTAEDFADGLPEEWILAGHTPPAAGGLGQLPESSSLAIYPALGQYAMDPSPDAADRYSVRFLLAPSHLNTIHGDVVSIFDALGNENLTAQSANISLRLRNNHGAYRLKTFVRLDGANALADSLPIDDQPQTIEIEWRAAADPDRPTGWFRLWINGELRSEGTALDNDQRRIEATRLGAMSLVGPVTGVYYLDDFTTWHR